MNFKCLLVLIVLIDKANRSTRLNFQIEYTPASRRQSDALCESLLMSTGAMLYEQTKNDYVWVPLLLFV